LAMVGATSKLVQDLPPYFIADGNPATVRTHNKVGLERAGYKADQASLVHQAFKILFRDGLNRTQSIHKLAEHPNVTDPILSEILSFYQKSTRGIC